MSLDKDTVKKVARLAHIRMDEEALDGMAQQLSKIIGFVEQLSEVETDNVAPLSNISEITLPLRDDQVTDGGYVEDVLANAPEKMQGYFVVPKVVE